MSDSEAEVSLVSSNGTLEGFTFEQVLEILQHAAQDAIETKDYLSYSTVLDIHLSEPGRFSADEREALLQQLLDSLSGNQELVYEVGWDIPALIIPFVDSEFNFHGGIRAAPGVYKVLKIFEVLALHGNAKELFLKSTELLSSLKSTDCTGNQEFAFKFFEIKLYCIFELISSSLRRIHTLYPSRFLAMAVSSFMNCLFINPTEEETDFAFFMKRMYSFARSYTAPPKPEKTDLPAEDLAKIEEDENFLQRKLLTALLTESVYMGLRLEIIGFTVSYFNHLHRLLAAGKTATLDFVLDLSVMFRLNELALSFDLSPQTEFEEFLVLSEKLVDFKAAAASEEETFSGDLFERLVVDFQNVFANCIVNAKTGSVSNALGGNLLLFTYEASSTNAENCIDISLNQAIAIAIRVIVPGIVHRSLYHRGMIDMAVFWCWYAVQRILALSKTLELELSSVPKAIMSTFLQALLYGITTHGNHSQFRYLALTLLTKILSAAPEDVSYSFIINALRECPFKGAKTVLIGVLRVLIISEKKVDDICESLKSLDLKASGGDQKNAPPLPARNSDGKSTFITLTESRADDVLSLVEEYIELTFQKSGDALQVNFEHLSTLLGLLNLLIPLRQSAFIKSNDIAEIIATTNKQISEVEKTFGENEENKENSVLLNAVTVLRVALNRLAE